MRISTDLRRETLAFSHIEGVVRKQCEGMGEVGVIFVQGARNAGKEREESLRTCVLWESPYDRS